MSDDGAISDDGAVSDDESSYGVNVDRYYENWLASVEHLMLDAEYEAFSALAQPAHRELFIRRFWQVRSSKPEGWRNRAYEVWRRNAEEVRRQFGDAGSDRARAMLLAGKPDQVMAFRGCAGPVRALEIWSFSPWQIEALADRNNSEGFRLVFFLDGEGQGATFRQWSKEDGFDVLLRDREAEPAETTERQEDSWTLERVLDIAGGKNCYDFDPREALIAKAALGHALDAIELYRRIRPAVPDPAWLDELTTDIAAGVAAPLTGRLVVDFPGNIQGWTVVRGRLEIPTDKIARSDGGHLFDRLVIGGDVWSNGHLIDEFRVEHHLGGVVPDAESVVLEIYRQLSPGDYTFSLRVEDAEGFGVARIVRHVTVPRVTVPRGSDPSVTAVQRSKPLRAVSGPAGSRDSKTRLSRLTANDVSVQTTFASVELLPPGRSESGGLVVGKAEVRAVTTGDVARVELELDGDLVATLEEPPYAAMVRFGRLPRRHRLAAVAFDTVGRELARDELVVNGGPHRFALRLIEPVANAVGPAVGWRARAIVEIPDQQALDRVELYLDEKLFATLYQSPFLHPLPPRRGEATFVRAVAYLDSGESIEDLVFLQAMGQVDEIDVRLVELYTSVVDTNDRFVTGLRASAFEVFEDGERQPITRFTTIDRLPIHVALLLDVSGSMAERLDIATASALRFFETVLDPSRDRAALLTFNHAVRLRVPFTNDIDRLSYGVSDLAAWQATRLHDGVIHASHYFGGLPGKRALVLLSDGEDMGSSFLFKDVLEHTLRSGVAVYPIAVDLVDPLTRKRLRQLASDTGGSFYSVDRVEQLDEIYRRLEEELRSQYLLVYQAADGRDDRFRAVEVKVSQASEIRVGRGLRARSIHGYYP